MSARVHELRPPAWRSGGFWLRRLVVPAGFAALFLWLAVRMVQPDADELWRALRGLPLAAVGGYVLLTVAAQTVRTVRWAALLRPLGHVPWRRLVPISLVGYMAVFTLPALGEFVRPWLVSQRGGLRGSAALATVVVERILDGLLVAFATFVALAPMLGQPETEGWVYTVCFGSLGLFVGASTVLVLLRWKRERVVRGAERALAPISRAVAERAASVLQSFLDGLGALPSRRVAFQAVALTILYWAINAAGFQVLTRGLGIRLGWLEIWAVVGVVVVGFLIPAPGQVGTYHFFFLLGLGLFVTREGLKGAGAALAVAFHGIQIVLFVTAGLIALFSREVRWGRRAASGAVLALLLVAPGAAAARTTRGFAYSYDAVWSGVVRFIRVDRGYEIRDKDKGAGYVLFTWKNAGKSHPASVELFAAEAGGGRRETRVKVDCGDLPRYEEVHFLDRLGEKLREEGVEEAPPGGGDDDKGSGEK